MVDFGKLSAPFAPDEIEWRVGSTNREKTRGLALAYLDARAVMDRLDDVCGPAGWQDKYSHANGKTVCDIGIKCGEEWVWKADGAGDTAYEAEKGALSDAFKRAAVRWGIGRYLYKLGSPWVDVEARGKSFVIPDRELPRLRALLTGEKPKPVAQPTQSAQDPYAAFWARENYRIPGDSTLEWSDRFLKAVWATPNVDALNKLHMDNADTIKGFPDGGAVVSAQINSRLGELIQAPKEKAA